MITYARDKGSQIGPKLRRLGFDDSIYERDTGYWRAKCSQCQAMVVNGTPCHETGCPNAKEKR